MKFIASLFFAALAATSVDASKVDLNSDVPNFVGASVTIANIANKASGQIKNSVVADCFMRAYNAVHHNDYEVIMSFVEEMYDVPEEPDTSNINNAAVAEHDDGYWTDMFMRTYWLQVGFTAPDGTNWSSDTLLPSSFDGATPTEDKEIMTQFEDTFCQYLQESGTASFVEVDNCEIYFTYSASSATQSKINYVQEKAKEAVADLPTDDTDDGYRIGTEFKIHHVRPTGTSYAQFWHVVEDAYVAAYNTIHQDTGFAITDFTMQRDLEIPEDAVGATLILATALFATSCDACNDKSNTLTTAMIARSGMHQAFEALFCTELRSSGLLDFDDVIDCEVKFMYHQAQSATM